MTSVHIPALKKENEILPGISTPTEDFWVFGYGSLIWNPGFDFIQAQKARIFGYHRKFCLQSTRYRGTVDNPGLVLGLDKGGSCVGKAFKVSAVKAVDVFNYLFEREMVRYAYRPTWIGADVESFGDKIPVLSFVVMRDHKSYKGDLTERQTAEILSKAHGPKGSNLAYLEETVASLKSMNVRDRKLEALLKSCT